MNVKPSDRSERLERDSVSFFSGLVGSLASMRFYASIPGNRHPHLVLHVLFISLVISVCWIVPTARRLAHVVNEYVDIYDERFPEIHVGPEKVSFVGAIPVEIPMKNGKFAIFDTTGTYSSLDDYPEGSLLTTQSMLLVKKSSHVDTLGFGSLKLSRSFQITPAGVAAAKNRVLVWGIALGSIVVFLAVTICVFVVSGLGSGYLVLLDALRKGPVSPRGTFQIAAYALTPVAVLLGLALAFSLSAKASLVFIGVGYLVFLTVVLVYVERQLTTGEVRMNPERD